MMQKHLRSAILAALFALAGCAHAPAPTNPPETGAELIAPEALRADLTALYEGLQRAHYDLYANLPEAEYDRAYREALAALDQPLTREDAQIRFQRFAALGNIAHGRVDMPMQRFFTAWTGGGRIFPFGVRIEAGRIFVAENLSGNASISPGAEILAIDGVRAAEWLERLGAYVSADNSYLLHTLIEPQFSVLLWFELGERDTYRVRVRDAAGAERQIAIRAQNREAVNAARARIREPLELDPTERVARMLDGGIGYLRPGVFMNIGDGADPFDTASFHAFIDESFERFLAEGARALIIDLRDNPGGDNSFSDHMIAWFADRPFRFASSFRVRVSDETIAANAARLSGDDDNTASGRYAAAFAQAQPGEVIDFDIPNTEPRAGERFAGPVYVLVNRRSFSNAVSVAAIVQDYGFGQVLGEPTADLATTLGAMEHFTLPNTEIVVGYPKALIVRPNGDAHPAGVTPDTVIGAPLLDFGEDAVLTRAAEIARAAR